MQVTDRNREVRITAVLAVTCLVLQLALAPNLGIGNGRANFALVYVGCVALFPHTKHPALAGFLAGLVFDLCTTGPIGLMAFCLTLAGFALGLEGPARAAGDLGSSMMRFSVVAVGVSLVYHLAMLLTGATPSLVDALFLRALPTVALTVLAFLPFAYCLSRMRSAGSGLGLGRRGSHLSGKGL